MCASDGLRSLELDGIYGFGVVVAQDMDTPVVYILSVDAFTGRLFNIS